MSILIKFFFAFCFLYSSAYAQASCVERSSTRPVFEGTNPDGSAIEVHKETPSVSCNKIIGMNSTAFDQFLRTQVNWNQDMITRLIIDGKQLDLTSSTFRPFPNLDHIKITGRESGRTGNTVDPNEKRSTIQLHTFKENHRLNNLVLSGIEFPTVEHLRGVFRPLFTRLVRLYLSDCSFANTNNVKYDPFEVIREFTKLEYVYIEKHDWTTVPANAFEKSAGSMKHLYLTKNKLTTVNVDAFKGMVKLRKLSLSDNQIASIEPGTFTDLNALEEIDLSQNPIARLPSSLFRTTRNMKKLNLKRTRINKSVTMKRDFSLPEDCGIEFDE